jgi:hypothetical protein
MPMKKLNRRRQRNRLTTTKSRRRSARIAAVGVVAALAVAAPALAQGNSQGHKKSSPPSKSDLPPATGVGGSSAGVTPFGWLDDASVLDPGAASLVLSIVRWAGADLAETNIPVVDVGLGLVPRVQLSANVPRVVGSDQSSGVGGLGTSYLGAKIGVVDDRASGVKLAVAPTLEILGTAVASALDPNASRVQWGLPVSIELDRGAGRAFAGAGFFSRGIWFAGAGVGVQAAPRVTLSGSFTRSWSDAAVPNVPLTARARNELSGGALYSVTPRFGVYGAVGHTIATLDENAAGLTLAAGIAISAAPPKP